MRKSPSLRPFHHRPGSGVLHATFIGHQGWLLSSGGTHVLVDPLLTEGFGHGGLAGSVFPPRDFDFERMPSIDAVWLTHEHDDHVCFSSLCRLDRAVKIYVSSRSSAALSGALEDLGFDVTRVHPGATVQVGSLVFQALVADHRATPFADEWDVLPFLATDASREAGFASSVDVPMPDALLDAVAASQLKRWLLCIANNSTDVRFVHDGIGPLTPTDDTDALAKVLGKRWRNAASRAGEPCFTAITGGGWSHPVDVAWIDGLAFCIDPERLARELSEACSARVCAMRPGEGVALGVDCLEQTRSDWLRTVPTSRPAAATTTVPHAIAPASGRLRLCTDDWAALEAGLEDLAGFLFGRDLFLAAHSVSRCDPALGMLLHDEGGDRTYVWSPPRGTFVRGDIGACSCRLRLWASDFLALVEGRIGPSALCYTGRVRCLNRDPDSVRVSPQILWLFAHPLHRPGPARRLYDASASAGRRRG